MEIGKIKVQKFNIYHRMSSSSCFKCIFCLFVFIGSSRRSFGTGFRNDRDDRYGGSSRDDRYGGPPRDDRYGSGPPRDRDDRYGGGPPRDDRYGGPPRDDRYGPPRDRYGGGDR